MNRRIQISNSILYFSKWTRASFATFRSIGKMIKIAFLNFDIHISLFENLYLININNQYFFQILYEFNNLRNKKNKSELESRIININKIRLT